MKQVIQAGLELHLVSLDSIQSPPVVHITSPFANQEIKKGARFPLAATAVDGLDGDVTGTIRWDDVTDRNNIFEITKGFGKKTKVNTYTLGLLPLIVQVMRDIQKLLLI